MPRWLAGRFGFRASASFRPSAFGRRISRALSLPTGNGEKAPFVRASFSTFGAFSGPRRIQKGGPVCRAAFQPNHPNQTERQTSLPESHTPLPASSRGIPQIGPGDSPIRSAINIRGSKPAKAGIPCVPSPSVGWCAQPPMPPGTKRRPGLSTEPPQP